MDSLLKQHGKPNIVLIVIDSCRADRFSTYGHYRPTTPHIDELATNGLLFENAYSIDTATPLSHFALMSGQRDWNGRAWLEHASLGQRMTFLFRRVLRRLGLTDYVGGYDEQRHSLLKTLRSAGYFTLGISANHLVSPQTMPAYKGFDAYPEEKLSEGLFDDPWIKKRLKAFKVADTRANRQAVYFTADRVFNLAQESLQAENPEFEQPFFLFVNLMDCHDPYLVHSDYIEDFGFKPNSDFNGDLRNRSIPASKPTGETFRWTDSLDLDPQTVDLLRWNYDRCLGYADQQIGAFRGFLATMGQVENTVFIITADHGEQLGEHGFFTHSQNPTEQQTHIPLVVSGPQFVQSGHRIAERVSLVDIRPSVFDLIGIDDPFEHHSGSSLFKLGARQKASGSMVGNRDREDALLGKSRDKVTDKELALMEARLRDLGYMD